MVMKYFSEYGEKVDGYENRVLNEREARAAAGILFAFGLLSLTNSIMLGHIIFSKVFVAFFTFDFLIRVMNPSYSPSLLLGRFFVQNQVPEYVGATQKRFAWAIGLFLAVPMFYTLVLYPQANILKVIICVACLLLLITESAFSICAGCALYTFIKKEKATNCPGGVCEIRRKDKIQTFSFVQKIITSLATVSIIFGLYLFTMKVDNRTGFSEHVSKMMMSDKELKELEHKEYLKELEEFENDDSW